MLCSATGCANGPREMNGDGGQRPQLRGVLHHVLGDIEHGPRRLYELERGRLQMLDDFVRLLFVHAPAGVPVTWFPPR